MSKTLIAISAVSLSLIAPSISADAREYRGRQYHRVAHNPVRHRAPDFLIHAYLPRYTETPLYNEPPARFPQR